MNLFKLLASEIQSYIYSGKIWTGFGRLLWYQVFINWTGIQLVFELWKEFTEDNWFLFCDVLWCTWRDRIVCTLEIQNIVNSCQHWWTLLKVWNSWLIIVLMSDCECVLWINGKELNWFWVSIVQTRSRWVVVFIDLIHLDYCQCLLVYWTPSVPYSKRASVAAGYPIHPTGYWWKPKVL